MKPMLAFVLSGTSGIVRYWFVIGCLTGLATAPSVVMADADKIPEPMLTRLEFRILDAGPGRPPVRRFRYSFTIHSAAADAVVRRSGCVGEAVDGVLRIPEPFPPFGRLELRIEADDSSRGYRYGLGSYSYRLSPDPAAEPPTVQLEPGIVLSGKVIDAETGQPVAGAQVAPGRRGYHDSWIAGNRQVSLAWGQNLWFDWCDATTTDERGRFRLSTRHAEDVAARHPDYRWTGDDEDFWSTPDPAAAERQPLQQEGILLQMEPLLTLRGRLVDANGMPVSSDCFDPGQLDPQGRFVLRLTREEWNRRDEFEDELNVAGFRPRKFRLSEFTLNRVTDIVLEPQPVPFIEGQVLDERGVPVTDCVIEIKSNYGDEISFQFETLPGPDEHGKWRYRVGESVQRFTLRVSLDAMARSVRQYTREDATKGRIVTRLGEGNRLHGRLVARVPLDATNTPLVYLAAAENGHLWQRATIQAGGTFVFTDLADGGYVLHLFPPMDLLRSDDPAIVDALASVLLASNSPIQRAKVPVRMEGNNVELPIDLHTAGILPGRITGVAYHPDSEGIPFANLFGYICQREQGDFLSVGTDYLLQFVTDAEGRFQIDHWPPGTYVLRLSWNPRRYSTEDPLVAFRVESEEATELRLFAPEEATAKAPANGGESQIEEVYGNGPGGPCCSPPKTPTAASSIGPTGRAIRRSSARSMPRSPSSPWPTSTPY